MLYEVITGWQAKGDTKYTYSVDVPSDKQTFKATATGTQNGKTDIWETDQTRTITNTEKGCIR